MNAATELAIVPTAETALTVFTAPNGLDPWVAKIRAEVDEFQANLPDMSTVKSRQMYASMAHKIAKSKNALDAVGKALSAEQKEVPKKIDAERKRVWDLLEAWQKEVRKPLDDWQAAEDARIDGHTKTIDWLAGFLVPRDDLTLEQMRQQLDEVEAFEISKALDEFEADAARGKDKALTALREQIDRREKHEAELAAIARFNAEQAERNAQAERDRIAREAAERATREAEDRARAEREAAAQRERDAQLAAERRELELKLQAEQAEREKLAAQQRAEQAERDAQARAEQAAQAERQRQADEQARADEDAKAREADKAHRAAVNRAALEAFVAAGMPEECAKQAITLIAKRQIPAITISY